MKTKWIAVLLALLLLLQLAPAAMADQFYTSALGGYVADDTLYAFAWLPDYLDSRTPPEASLMDGFAQVCEMAKAERLCTRETPAEYLLLVDNSTSMDVYLPQLYALIAALYADGRNIRLTLATFGTEFTVQAEDLTDSAAAMSAVGELRFNERGTDICGGAAHAVAYACENLWQAGELAQIVLCTDGTPFYSKNTVTQAESQTAAAEALAQLLDDTPQVYLHMVCLSEWEPETYAALKHGCGMDLMAQDTDQAEYDGGLLASWYDALFKLEFPAQHKLDSLALRTQDNEIISLPRCAVAPAAEELVDVLDDLPSMIDTEPDEPDEPAETESEAPSMLPVEPSEEPSEDASAPEIPSFEIPPETVEETEGPTVEKVGGFALWGIPLIVGGVLVLAGLIVLLIALLSRKKTQPAPQAQVQQPGPNALSVRINILSGSGQGQSRQLWLNEHLMLGSDPRCDLVLTDSDVAPLHARIFRQGQDVMVEDLHSPAGTALGGMRLYMPNRLRSGDQLSLGSTVVSVQF